MKTFLFLFLLCQFAISANAQNDTYKRSSVTILFVKHSDNNSDLLNEANSVKIPDKYDDNSYGNNIINVSIPFNKTSQDESVRAAEIFSALNDQKVANNILRSIFINQSTGLTDLNKLFSRGEYNATDAEYVAAMNSQRKAAALKDKGADLLNSIHIIVYDIFNYKVEGKDKNQTYTIDASAYLYKIDMDEILKTGAFWDLIDFEQPDKVKQNNFNNYYFPIKYILKEAVSSFTSNIKTVDASNIIINLLDKNAAKKNEIVYKSNSEINLDLLENLVSNSDTKINKDYESFKVKLPVYSSDPLTIKVGRKESLKIDHLYKITENRIDKKGTVTVKKIGWVRAKKVSDNRSVSNGKSQPSIFYKARCGNIQKGMGAVYTPESGFVFGGSYILGNSIMSGAFINAEYITRLSPGLRVGVTAGGFNNQVLTNYLTFTSNGASTGLKLKGTNQYFDLFFSKIIQLNRIEIIPYIGPSYTMMSYQSYTNGINEINITNDPNLKDLKSTTLGAMGGIKLGINLGKHLQINGGYKLGYNINTKIENNKTIYIGNSSNTLDINLETPQAITVGIRLFGF